MRPRRSHPSKSYVLRPGTVDGAFRLDFDGGLGGAAAGVGLANCVISILLEVLRSTKDTRSWAAARPHRIFT
jgi:hypothetical protein